MRLEVRLVRSAALHCSDPTFARGPVLGVCLAMACLSPSGMVSAADVPRKQRMTKAEIPGPGVPYPSQANHEGQL